MAVTAPIDGEMQHDELTVDNVAVDEVVLDEVAADEIVIIPDDAPVRMELQVSSTGRQADPVMPFLYLGIITLLAIIATSAFLAL